jgi:hypothetical protein
MRIAVQTICLEQIVRETLSQKTQHKKGLAEWLKHLPSKHGALSLNLVPPKKKKRKKERKDT